MFGWFEPDVFPIGIDVGTHSVRLVQFERRKDQLALQAARRIELDAVPRSDSPEKHLAAVIAAALDGAGFKGRRCVLALPPAKIPTKSVRLPQMPEADLAQAVQWEAKDRFGFDLAEARLVFFRSGEVRRGTEVKDELLLFAAPGEALRSCLESCNALHLTVEAIDLAPCALLRAAHRVAPLGQDGIAAMLDIGHSGSQFLIAQDEHIVFYKHIEVGGRAMTEAIAAKLGVSATEAAQIRTRLETADPASAEDASASLNQAVQEALRPLIEDLARELDMCVRYFVVTFRGARPEQIHLTGRQAHSARLVEALNAGLGLHVEPLQPLRGVSDLGAAARPDRSSEWAVAAGLSLYPVAELKNQRAEVAA
jgi:type IV pilus assembly protein PilM